MHTPFLVLSTFDIRLIKVVLLWSKNLEWLDYRLGRATSYSSPKGGQMTVWALTTIHAGAAEPYGRDVKFRPNFKSGMEKRLFSVPLLMTWHSQNAPNCTDLHLYIQKFSGDNTPWPPELGRGKEPPQTPPLDEHPPSHFFRASATAAYMYMLQVVLLYSACSLTHIIQCIFIAYS